MHSLSALIFPYCSPLGTDSSSLLSFFDALGFFVPDEQNTFSAPQPETKRLFSSLCPFAADPDNERFRLLIKELAGHGREFYLHTLSSMKSASGSNEEASVSSLLSLLTGKSGLQQPVFGKNREKRWQARLVLQLFLLLAEEEEEISRSLDAINNQRGKMLAALQGIEQDDPTAISSTSPKRPFLACFSDTQQLNLLYAWAFFYLASPTALDMIPCTSLPVVAETLFDAYKKRTRQQAVELCGLRLACLGDLGQPGYFDRRTLNMKETEGARLRLGELLRQAETSSSITELRKQCISAASAWQENQTGDAEKTNGILRFYCLPGVSLFSLFSSLLGETATEKKAKSCENGLFAVLNPY